MTTCVDFGWFTRPDGRRALLSWWCDGAVTLDGPGGAEYLGLIATEDRARAVFEGWADELDRPIAWVHARMLAFNTGRMVGS